MRNIIFALVYVAAISITGDSGMALSPDGQPAAPITFHISPGGSDDNPGTKERPFATPQGARDAIRALKKKQGGTLRQPVTVVLHDGTYRLQEPFVLTPQDSGAKDAPILYTAAPGARPVLSGGKQLQGWKETSVGGKKLWMVEIPEVKAGKSYFHQLFINGQRRTRARHPNDGVLRIAGLPDVKKDTPRYPGQKRFQFAAGDIRAWENLQDVDVIALHLWVAVRLAVTSVDEQAHIINFRKESRRTLMDGSEFARYYVENAFELVDSPGEWYLNRKTGVLYYWPMPDEKMPDAVAIAPALPYIVRFAGRPEKGQHIEHITLRGLAFAHADMWPAREDTSDAQANVNLSAVVQGDGMRQCTIERCTVMQSSGYGIHLARGCNNNTVARCEVVDLGAGGIRIGEEQQRQNSAEQTHDNTVMDCHIHHCGAIFHQAVGVWIGQSFSNRVAHNHIHDLLYTGISCGWTWGYGKTLARNNIIEYNHVHDIGKGLLSDMGGIYTLGVQPGTIIRHNVFHDIDAYHYGGWGIYFDEGSTHIVAENNLVYNTKHGGFHQHYGKDNIVRNNIFAFGKEDQIRRTRIEDHRSFTFERNIVYWKTGDLLDGNWSKLNAEFDHNLYWKVGGPGKGIRFAQYSWEQWREKGMDKHSLIADPLFVDAAKYDFRLREDTPAKKIGFVPFDVSHVGPRQAREGGGSEKNEAEPGTRAIQAEVGDEGKYPGLENVLKLTHRIYSGGEPRGEEGFASLAKLGIKVIISVDGARPKLELAKKHGLRYVHIPIGYDGVPEKAGQSLARLVQDLDGPFYIHCHHGEHRGPAAAAIACIADGAITATEAPKILQRAGTSKEYAGLWRDVSNYVPPKPGTKLPELVEAAAVDSLAAAMAQIDRNFDNLKLCQKAGWKTPPGHPDIVPAQEALILREGFREAARHEGNRFDARFRGWLTEAESLARTVEDALRGGNLEQATRQFQLLSQSCKQCHGAYRN